MKLKKIFYLALYGISLVLCQTAKVSVIVHPKILPENENIFISGNSKQLGNWNPGSVALQRVNDTTWQFQDTFQISSHLEFKITRGSWKNEALYQFNTLSQNIALDVLHDTTILLTPITWADNVKLPEPEKEIIGIVKHHIQLSGRGLRYAHDIIVRLPKDYNKSPLQHYSVLYMHDGQNLFDPSTAFAGHDWRMDEVVDSLVQAKKMDDLIIVGINNSPDRLPEYSDSELGRAYVEFIVTVVKPIIDSTYRTKPDKKNTAIMGSSMGGLISFLAAWWHPDIFSMAGAMSPSFWFDGEKTVRDFRSSKGSKKHLKFYLDCGGGEKELLPGYKEMISILQKKGFKKNKDLDFFVEKGAVHNEQAWSHRVWRPLLFFFGKEK